MARVSIREMSSSNRKRKSLSATTFLLILSIVFLIGSAVFLSGFYLFSTTLGWETKEDGSTLTDTEADLLNTVRTRRITDEILRIYDSIPEEEKGDGSSEEYQAAFDGVLDDDFRQTQKDMYRNREGDNMRSCFIAAVSKEEDGRLIYLIDDDPKKTFCRPGTWDVYRQSQLNNLIFGAKPSRLETMMGLRESIPHIWDVRNETAICTTSARLYETDRYYVLVFMDRNMNQMGDLIKSFVRIYGILLLIISLLAAVIGMLTIRKRIVRPINQMANAASAYSEDRKENKLDSGYFQKLDIHTGNEIENLSLTMKDMEQDIAEYVRDLTTITAEQERIRTELDLARRIQEASLPSVFPPYPDRGEFDLYASMVPAKEVGGDFYDFFLIDDDHLALVIADVSGKGMPAALFMMGARITISDYVMASGGDDPGKILSNVNEQITANNPLEMFVTVWLGILEISTGKLKAANAGHEYPAIRRRDGSFELLIEKHGLVIGAMEGISYKSYELQLCPGDIVFEYTDGVTEATDADKQLFGTERMLEVLNKDSEADPETILQNVTGGIEMFVKDEQQFDDTTMLCLRYNGNVCKDREYCGGCSYQGIPYEEQLANKFGEVKGLLEEKQISCGQLLPIEPAPAIYGYRNKMEYTFGDMEKGGPMTLGMHRKKHFMSIVTVDECQLVHPDFNRILSAVLDFAGEHGYTKYHKKSHKGLLRNLILRRGVHTGELLVNIVTTSEGEEGGAGPSGLSAFDEPAFVQKLKELPLEHELVGVLRTINDRLADAVYCDELRILDGRDYYNEEILGLKFRVSAFSFFQTNVEAVENLYSYAIGLIDDFRDKKAFDLFCGTGTISQVLARSASEVVGVELVEEAVEGAREAARENGLDNCRFIAGDVFEVLSSIPDQPDVIVVDPPRAGISVDALDKIISYGVDQIVYISCNPKSLAQNLYQLQLGGYRVESVKPFDNFPWTRHVETVCLLGRRKPDDTIKVSVNMDDYYQIRDAEEAEKNPS
ncbi:MAG: 23S rRNA (uracil(1939)-C(5))-methyltransferase RlmD, partial [Firmicutes bacterium]|nr:23S rRNA (uracil(1939)-C(5))-methyltransferase RlmD [Bacillota bacterium]